MLLPDDASHPHPPSRSFGRRRSGGRSVPSVSSVPVDRSAGPQAPALLTALALTAVLAAPSGPAAAQDLDYYFAEGTSFDPDIPSPGAFLGYEIGTLHTRHDRIVDYMRELARLSDRATYREIGMTHEHRPMPVLTVTTPDSHARLEEIRTAHLAATEAGLPGRDAAAGDDLSGGDPAPGDDLPVIVHLGYGVHGNETSSAEAAMLTAYWLVAGRGPELDRYRAEGIWHVEPNLNPDGRDRHTWWANMHRAEPFVTDPLDREHNEVWPGGRTNHYWFDLNRDWLPLVHPESRARIDFHHAWRPHVVTDYHEMGTSSTYFFEPSEPIGSWNPLLPERLYTDITLRFADDWAESLDAIGSLYFTKEVYDNSYPGYGSTYPNFLGGLGLVFEQASARGHAQESEHHGVLTFPFAIRNHLRTSLATVETAVEERAVLRTYQRDFFRTAVEEAEAYPVDGWIFGDPLDRTLNRDFLDLLLRHRIEVHELSEPRTVDGTDFRPGAAWVVPAAQPQYRLARSIFERTETFQDSVFYDASTWTISLAYGIPDGEIRNGSLPLGEQVTETPQPVLPSGVDRSEVAYLIDWRDSGAQPALQALLARGVRAHFAMQPFTLRTTEGEVDFGRGTITVPVGIQEVEPDRLHRAVEAAQRIGGVPVRSAVSGYATGGPDLGSRNQRPVVPPKVLLPVGDGVSAYEAGQLWHLLDQRVGLPVTKVDVHDVGRIRWSDYTHLVLVSGGHGFLEEGDRLEELREWIRAGGTLVAIRGAAAWAARNGLTPNVAPPGIGAPRSEPEEGPETGAGDAGGADPGNEGERRDWADAAEIEGAQSIGGSIWAADLDVTHPLGFGYRSRVLPVWRDHAYFFEPSENPYSTVARLTDDPHLSGYVSDENERRLRHSPSVLADELGGGAVVLLVDNPNFRGYWRGTQRLFLNALYFANAIDVP